MKELNQEEINLKVISSCVTRGFEIMTNPLNFTIALISTVCLCVSPAAYLGYGIILLRELLKKTSTPANNKYWGEAILGQLPITFSFGVIILFWSGDDYSANFFANPAYEMLAMAILNILILQVTTRNEDKVGITANFKDYIECAFKMLIRGKNGQWMVNGMIVICAIMLFKAAVIFLTSKLLGYSFNSMIVGVVISTPAVGIYVAYLERCLYTEPPQ